MNKILENIVNNPVPKSWNEQQTELNNNTPLVSLFPKPQTASDSLSPVKERLLELQNKFIDQLNKIRGDCDIIEARIKTRVIKVNDEFAHLGLMFNDTVQKSREMTEALAEIQKTIGD